MFGKTDNPQVAKKLNRWKRVFPGKSRAKFAHFLKEFAPDIVLSTHYLPLETLSSMRHDVQKHRGSVPSKAAKPPYVVSIVTDFEAHALWMDDCVDLYCVAAEETKARLIARGAAAENILATGIPIASKFSSRPDPKRVRQALGLRDDQPVMLVLSGGFGMGPIAQILEQLDKVEQTFQIVVVTGRNPELRSELAGQDHKHPTHVLGFASNMHELVAISDLIISKPGGLTTSEVLAMGKPLFIVNPIPGQEAANSDFLLERGAAAKVNRVEDLPFRIGQLLASKKLSEMAKAAKALGRPEAARQICEESFRRVQRLPELANAGL
jgi:processive 1,2-diacylglycerol beta-glucosyltransferase